MSSTPPPLDGLVPIGATVTAVYWWSVPDKYAGPERFETLSEARAYNSVAYIVCELELRTDDDDQIVLCGDVPFAEQGARKSPRQDPGVQPIVGGILASAIPRKNSGERREEKERLGLRKDDARTALISYEYSELVFRNPDGSRFVLYPARHPMSGRLTSTDDLKALRSWTLGSSQRSE
jgi:hypothetical protein